MNINTQLIKKHKDDRGCFFEVPNITSDNIYQSSISISNKDVLRGLHYQNSPKMGKQINIVQGSIIECILDIRVNSESFGKHMLIHCNSDVNNCIYIPPGFAHGFLSLEDNTIIMYHQTAKYNKLGEGSIDPFDPSLQIEWGISKSDCIMSEKDRNCQSLLQYKNSNISWS